MFPVGVSLMEDGQSHTLPPPQLVMLANVASVTSAEGGGCDGSVADEKEMMELKTVGCSYSDSEDESIIRYSYDNQKHREVCIIEYPESRTRVPKPSLQITMWRRKRRMGTKLKICPGALCPASPPLAPRHLSRQPNHQQDDSGEPGGGTQQDKDQRGRNTEAPSGGEGEGSEDTGTAGDIKGLIRCERCGYNTNRYDHYIAHLKHHSKEGEDHRVFKCTLCPYTTVSQYHWRKHLRNHFPSKLHTCSQCSYFSDRKSNYIQHIRTHTGVRPFQCPYCDYSSSQKTHLTRHMRTHSGERPFKCESCNYLAANQHEVTRHARQVHNGPKPLSCPYCDYKTADRSNFKKHVELHLNPRQFLCPLCKYAASKKCNLQYHIKSRHSGCNVAVDVSKVKLRVKKTGPEDAEENSESRANKVDNSSSIEEDFIMDNGNENEDVNLSPINLSIKKSSRPSATHLVQSDTPAKAQKKCNAISEKPPKTKDRIEPDKKVTTRQKKVDKVNENPVENTSAKEAQTEHKGSKGKRRVKKLPTDKTTGQVQTEVPEIHKSTLSHQTVREKSDQQRSVEEKLAKQKVGKEQEKLVSEKEKEQQTNDGSGKENKSLNKLRKSGSKKSEKITENVDKAQKKSDTQKETEKEKVVKEKAVKRKAVDALDLSTKSSSEAPSKAPSKAKRLKISVAEKLQSKPALDRVKASEVVTLPKSRGTMPAKQKKTRNSKKRLQQTVEDKTFSVNSSTTDSPEASPQLIEKNTPTDETTPAEPEKMEVSPTCSSGENTPSPAEDRTAPAFLKPTSPPFLVFPGPRTKPADGEDDEGIHSSHEGASDISDSASEGSDDSGLNGRSVKMANDPETPTDEIPTPTELKSHMCIFCDRTFPLEVEYRRHLNRHLVNVYYMENSGTGQK
ncbi:hypothetical protein Q5P01_008540 [Channa striata]|uniref:C2H2-type domain-containing protein n=1 Tax=Channa striata TaxID=64152 RepID=A0AA88MZK2_CHASR|nr:hypothetical protein Q5P01_008540 [Channa striata]